MPDTPYALGQVGTIGRGFPLSTPTNTVDRPILIDPSGAQVIMDFYLKSMIDQHAFQVRAGTITTPLTGTTAITDTSAEYCIDPIPGYTALPVCQIISVRLGTGTIHEYQTKSVATASTSGTAYSPIPLFRQANVGAVSCTTTARVAATAGTVTVTLELATTTRRHWSFSQPIAMGAYDAHCVWEPRMPPGIRSISGAPRCLYTQVAAGTTGPDYYANLDFLEFVSNQIGLA